MHTINYDFYEKILTMNLINNVPGGLHMCYNKRSHKFNPYKINSISNPNLVVNPCAYLMKSAIWKEFYAMLTPEEYALAKSYPYRRGFFDYLRETGLDGIYEEARMIVIVREFQKWLTINNITI